MLKKIKKVFEEQRQQISQLNDEARRRTEKQQGRSYFMDIDNAIPAVRDEIERLKNIYEERGIVLSSEEILAAMWENPAGYQAIVFSRRR